MSARNVGATARWIGKHHPETGYALVCTGRTTEDRACARHLDDLLRGAEPKAVDLVAGVLDGAGQHARSYARKPAPDRVDLSAGLPFCRDVDRSGFALVGEVREDHVALAPMPS